MALQEANMVARQASSQSLKSVAGALLLALGLVFLFANLEGIAACMSNFAGISAHETVGIVPILGLAGMHAVQAYTFDHDAFLLGLRQNLVSFWPLIVVAIGAALLKSGFAGPVARLYAKAGSSAAERR
jgi:ascorbate-specific PTS system EIIC-type component UlaA